MMNGERNSGGLFLSAFVWMDRNFTTYSLNMISNRQLINAIC
jgi:hypothetical protein